MKESGFLTDLGLGPFFNRPRPGPVLLKRFPLELESLELELGPSVIIQEKISVSLKPES